MDREGMCNSRGRRVARWQSLNSGTFSTHRRFDDSANIDVEGHLLTKLTVAYVDAKARWVSCVCLCLCFFFKHKSSTQIKHEHLRIPLLLLKSCVSPQILFSPEKTPFVAAGM